MPGWREEYLASIQDAESANQVNQELVQACSALADRISALEAEKAVLQASLAPGIPSAEQQATSPKPGTPSKGKAPADPADAAAAAAASPAETAKLRLDLAEALRTNGQLQARLRAAEDEAARLRSRAHADSTTARGVAAERDVLARRARDRDEELRAKKKLLADVQDELTVLTLQLNVAEQKTARVQAENKQLVERWMQKMAQEADALNLASEPFFAKERTKQ